MAGSPRDESVRSATGRIRPKGELADVRAADETEQPTSLRRRLRLGGARQASTEGSNGDLRADRAKITFRRANHRRFRVGQNIRLPPRAVNLIELKWLDHFENAVNGS